MTIPQPARPVTQAPPSRRAPAAIFYAAGVAAVAAVGLFTMLVVQSRRAASAAQADEKRRTAETGAAVLVASAQTLPAGRTVILPGEVKPWKQANLYAKVSGYVKTISVDKGDRVKQGQVLATLESPETDQQVLSARADLSTKRLVAERYEQLAPRGVVSTQDLEQARGSLAVARAELARVTALQAYETIGAPFDGIVTARLADPGALLPAATGSTAGGQPLVELTDMSRLRIYAYLAQSDAPFVHEGAAVKLESDATPGQASSASVTRITRELDARTRTMLTEIDVDNARGWAYPGLFVRVTMTLETPGGVGIPADAVFLRDGKPTVAVIEGGHARFTAIEAGDDDGRVVRVLSGLRAGDVVALHAGDEVADGAPVRAVPAASAGK